MTIRENAGKLRGVRVVRDPDGILLDPFVDDMGGQVGYVVVYGEGSPAVYDGENWVSILNISEDEWNENIQKYVMEQGEKIAQAAQTNEIYRHLLAVVYASAGISTESGDMKGPNSETTYYGA